MFRGKYSTDSDQGKQNYFFFKGESEQERERMKKTKRE